MHNEYYYVWDPSLGVTLQADRSEQGAKCAIKYTKMGHRQVLWESETTIGGDEVALGLTISYISLSPTVLESKMER